MNLFRRHKKFEQQLHEQLGDLEVKPSQSLWDRIDSNITNDGFENKVQNSVENFEQMPYPETWDKIEAELPTEKAGNGLLKYYIVAAFAVLFATGIYIGNKLGIREQGLGITEQGTGISGRGLGNIEQNNFQQEKSNKTASQNQPRINTSAASKTSAALSDNIVKTQSTQTLKPKATQKKLVNRRDIGSNNTTKASAATANVKPHIPTINKTKEPKVIAQHNTQNNKANKPANTISNEAIVLETIEPLQDNTISQNENNKLPVNTSKQIAQPDVNNNRITEEQQTATNKHIQEQQTATLEKPREIIETKPDSAAYAQHIQTLNTKPNANNDLTRFSISVYAGAHLSYTTYGKPQKKTSMDFQKNIELRKQLETPTVDWAGAFLLDYRLNDRWMVSSGISMVNFNQQFEYNIERATDTLTTTDFAAPTLNPTDSFVVGNLYSNRIKYSWTEIPLFINYTIVKGSKWNIDMQAGVSYAFISTIDGGMIGYDNKGVLVLRGKESFPNIKNTVFLTAMPQVSYSFGSSVSIGLAPTVKYSLTSIIGNERWIQQHPYFIGMNICLRKRF